MRLVGMLVALPNLIFWSGAGSQEHLLDVDSSMVETMPNSRQRMIPPDVQGDSDEAVSQQAARLRVKQMTPFI